MRLLVADKLDTRPFEELRVLGVEIVARPELTSDELPEALKGIGILVVRGTSVTRAAIEQARQLNLIVRVSSSGAQNVDVGAASERGVYVAVCAGRSAQAVAELTMAFALALDRRLVDATVALRSGKWDRDQFLPASGLFGRRIGVAGLGTVGREVISRARAFGMEPHAWSRTLTANKAARLEVNHARNLEELAARSDVFTVHLPLTPQTQGVIGRSVLAALPEGAIFINTARAELVDYEALGELCETKGLRCGLDVFPGAETSGVDGRILSRGTVYATPGVGASTEHALAAGASEAARVVRSFLTEETVPNVVNICASSPARYVVVLRMKDKVGVLANTLNVLKRHGINIEEISNTVFDGAIATCTKLRVTGRPTDGCLREITAFDEVLHVDVVAMPIRA